METGTWYIAERAEQLAILHLSRRDDLVITHSSESGYGFDILVSISKDGKPTGRMFGVVIKAKKSLQSTLQKPLAINEMSFDLGKMALPKDIPFPLCLFIFEMENDQGYYRWIKEPVIDAENKAVLLAGQENAFKALTKEALDHIVGQINLWYEQRTA